MVVDDQMWLLGGFWTGSLNTSDRVDVLDPTTQIWSSRTNMPTALTHHGVAQVGRTIYVAGGFVGDHPGPVTDEVWLYDIDADTWSAGPDLPFIRGAGALIAVGNDLHFFGGVGNDKDVSEADHWVYDTASPSGWNPLAPMPNERNHFSATLFNGKIYAFGGQYRHDKNSEDLTMVHAYEVGTDTWTQVADMPYELSHVEPGTFTDGTGPVLAGGRSNVTPPFSVNRIIRYDPTEDAWSDLPPLPRRLLAPAVQLIQGVLHLSGGGQTALTPESRAYKRPHQDYVSLPLLLNCGGAGYDGPVQHWCEDSFNLNGRSVINPGIVNVNNTTNDELYRSERQGSNSDTQHAEYRILVGNGAVHVRLHFAETYWNSNNRRKFDVAIEGVQVIDDLDVHSEVGHDSALMYEFDALVNDEYLDIAFESSLDRPTIAGIEVEAIAPALLSNYCIAASNSVGDGALISCVGSLSVAANDFTLRVQAAPIGEPGLFIQGENQLQQPFGAGHRCVGGNVTRLGPASTVAADGSADRTVDLLNPPTAMSQILPGSSWNFQFWYRDSAQATFNLSNGLNATFAP
ncbi:MAG: hypothetical protein ACI841_003255 [Planctomycetota bacterium]|jgi:hypothetical protein